LEHATPHKGRGAQTTVGQLTHAPPAPGTGCCNPPTPLHASIKHTHTSPRCCVPCRVWKRARPRCPLAHKAAGRRSLHTCPHNTCGWYAECATAGGRGHDDVGSATCVHRPPPHHQHQHHSQCAEENTSRRSAPMDKGSSWMSAGASSWMSAGAVWWPPTNPTVTLIGPNAEVLRLSATYPVAGAERPLWASTAADNTRTSSLRAHPTCVP